uniref:Uncharacterized protein n=1 Tax=Opuntia streptacantha TaxID=393608 RepID=A0A7C9ACY3_OPUST
MFCRIYSPRGPWDLTQVLKSLQLCLLQTRRLVSVDLVLELLALTSSLALGEVVLIGTLKEMKHVQYQILRQNLMHLPFTVILEYQETLLKKGSRSNRIIMAP